MSISNHAKRSAAFGLLSIGAIALLTGCQSCPPVRECCNPPLTTTASRTTQECPDGIHRLAGGPLYYESQNANWEQAPPFGRW